MIDILCSLYIKTALICKEVLWKKVIAETSNKMAVFVLIILKNDTMGVKVLLCDYTS